MAAAALGVCVYFLLPIALLSGSITLLLDVFFGLLMTMLLGLVIFAMNICHIIEHALLILVFWCWESRGVYQTIRLNLRCHRVRNRHSQVSSFT